MWETKRKQMMVNKPRHLMGLPRDLGKRASHKVRMLNMLSWIIIWLTEIILMISNSERQVMKIKRILIFYNWDAGDNGLKMNSET